MRRLILTFKRFRLAILRADLSNGCTQYAKWKAKTEKSIAALELELLFLDCEEDAPATVTRR